MNKPFTLALIAGGIGLIFWDEIKGALGLSQEATRPQETPPVWRPLPAEGQPQPIPNHGYVEERPPTEQPAGRTGGDRQAPRATADVLARMAQVAGADRLTFDQWNYYYQQVTGQPGPAPELVGLTRTDPMPLMTLTEWADLVGAVRTLSGIVRRYFA